VLAAWQTLETALERLAAERRELCARLVNLQVGGAGAAAARGVASGTPELPP
jgi:hypothetical protein